MPLGSDRPSTKTNRKVIVADFNDRSVGEKSKCLAIIDVIVDNDVDVLRLTEPSGDEAKCTATCHPLATGLSASLVLHVAVASHSLARFLSITADFSFPHSSFKLSRLTFSLPQRTLYIFCLYRPPPNRKNQLKDSLFMEQFPDLLE